jgi:hypothetical protein
MVVGHGGQQRLQAVTITDPSQHEGVRKLRAAASEGWKEAGHEGWTIPQLPLVSVRGAVPVLLLLLCWRGRAGSGCWLRNAYAAQ